MRGRATRHPVAGGGGRAKPARRAVCLRGIALLVSFLVFGLLAALCAGPAQAKEWRIERMDVLLDVQENSDVLVSESVSFAFTGQFSFVTRFIPLVNLDDLTDIRVSRDGVELPRGTQPGTWDTFREHGYQVIQLNFSLADTTAAWTIDYRAVGAVHYLEDVDELRWYVLDAETPVPIGEVRTEVRLPGQLSREELSAAVRTGSDTEWRVFGPSPSVVVFEARGLAPFTEFWTATSFPRGVVAYRWTVERVVAAVVPRLGFVLPLLALLTSLVILLRRRTSVTRFPHASYVTEPPSALAPALAGVLLDQRVERREAAATLVDLARRGYVSLRESPLGSAADPIPPKSDSGEEADETPKALPGLVVSKLKMFEDLSPFERALAHGVAESVSTGVGVEYDPSRVPGAVGRAFSSFSNLVYEEAVDSGFFVRNPETVKNLWYGRGGVVAIVGVVAAVLAWGADVPGTGYMALGSVAAGVILIVFGRFMPVYTHKGALERSRWQAFRAFLEDLGRFEGVERADQLYQEYLPYAIAFGVERLWAQRFSGLAAVPAWFAPRPEVEEERRRRAPGVFPSRDISGARPPSAAPWGTGAPGGTFVPPRVRSNAPVPGAVSGLDDLSDRLFKGLESFSVALTSAPRLAGSRSSDSDSVPSRSSYSSGSASSSSSGSSFSGGGGGGGFRAG